VLSCFRDLKERGREGFVTRNASHMCSMSKISKSDSALLTQWHNNLSEILQVTAT
jgi:CTP-dependent riboflavin kinase